MGILGEVQTSKKSSNLGKQAVIDKLYIVLDYNKNADADRDNISFLAPKREHKLILSDSLNKHKGWYENNKDWIMKKIVNPVLKKYPKEGDDTLSSIGWKGIWAMDIGDALVKVREFMKVQSSDSQKIKSIVIRTHGGFDTNTTDFSNPNKVITGVIIDNNWGHLSDEERSKSGKTTNAITSANVEDYSCKSGNLEPDEEQNVKLLIELVSFVETDGDFVIGSCFSAYNQNLLGKLQLLTGSRVNMYGVKSISSFSYTYPKIITITLDYKNNTYIHGYSDKNIEGGDTAYIIRSSTFSDTNLVSSNDYEGNPDSSNCAYKFPAGRKEGDSPIKLKDLRLNDKGINAKE